MKIEKGSKVTIKNSTDNTISLPIFKHNFRWDMKKDDEMTFPIQSVERACFYLKQKSLGLDVTIENEPAPTASKLQVNKTYSSITIDPTKITEDDMKEFLARVCGDEEIVELVTQYFAIQNVKNGSTIPNNAYMFGCFAEKGPCYLSLYGQTLSGGGSFEPISTDGWYIIERGENLEQKTSQFDAVLSQEKPITEVSNDFSELNGKVIYGVEVGSTEQTAIENGKTYSKFVIDPTAYDKQAMADWFSSITGSEVGLVSIDGADLIQGGDLVSENFPGATKDTQKALIIYNTFSDNFGYVYFYTDGTPIVDEEIGINIQEDGWYRVKNEDEVLAKWIPLTESITVTVPSEIPAIESINDDFNATLNGTVVTGVES